MKPCSPLFLLAAGTGLLVLAGLFQLYQNPLLEIYLSSWGLC
jgi:hypothetical protein